MSKQCIALGNGQQVSVTAFPIVSAKKQNKQEKRNGILQFYDCILVHSFWIPNYLPPKVWVLAPRNYLFGNKWEDIFFLFHHCCIFFWEGPNTNIFRDHFERPSENCQYQAGIKCLGKRMVMGKLSKWVQECPKTKMNDRTRNAQKEPCSFVFYLYTLVMREGIR